MAQIAFKQRCKHTLGNQFLNCFHLDKEIANLYEGALKFYYEIGKKKYRYNVIEQQLTIITNTLVQSAIKV